MKHKYWILSVLSLALALILLTGCVAPAASSSDPTGSSTDSGTPSSGNAPDEPSDVSSTPSDDEPGYQFPEDGVLKLLTDGKAPGVADGKNPSLYKSGMIVFFDFAFKRVGLDLPDETPISYTITKEDGTVLDGTAPLIANKNVKTENGYIGVCFEAGLSLERFESATFSLSFRDASGKEYFVNNKKVYKGLTYMNLSSDAFKDVCEGVTTTVNKNTITQQGVVYGTRFVFTIDLSKWASRTRPAQIVTISKLFWQVYPRMYLRFGKAANSPTFVTLAIENEGYGLASTGGNFVHLHDMVLRNNPNDYDCLTHEFAHVIQNGWDGDRCEYSGYIERFADCCRYLYALDDGFYNNTCWTMWGIDGESTRETSVRFLVWLDHTYSTEDNDLLLRFFTTCRSGKYPADQWISEAWPAIFAGSALEGKNIDQVFAEFAASEFARLNAGAKEGISELEETYHVRQDLKDREAAWIAAQNL